MNQKKSKQARKLNKQNASVKKQTDKAQVIFNVIITVIIVAFVGTGAYAVGSEYMKNKQNVDIQNQEQTQTETVKTAAENEGISSAEYLKKYGLSADIDENTSIGEVYQLMTLENVALSSGKTVEEFRAENFVPEGISNDAVWGEVINELPFKAVVGEENVDQLKQVYGLGDDITGETKWSEVNPILEQKQLELQQAQQNAADATSEQPKE